jgi:tetratricopeptide (TPR) repeat protein
VEADLRLVLGKCPTAAETRELLVNLLLRSGKLHEAIAQQRKLVDQKPEDLHYLARLGDLYLRARLLDALDASLSRWSERFPGVPAWHSLRGQLYMARQEPAAAAAEFARALESEGNPDVLRNYARALLQAGDPARALEAIESAASAGVDLTLLTLRGRALAALRRGEDAMDAFRQAMDEAVHRPGAVAAVVGAAGRCLSVRDMVLLLEACVERDTTGTATVELTRLLARQGDHERAIRILEQATRNPPSDKRIHGRACYQLAMAYQNAGRHREAKAMYERALVLTPDDPAVLNNLASELIHEFGQAERALPLAEKAVLLASQDPVLTAYCLATVGEAHAQLRQWSLARIAFQRSLRLHEMPAVRLALAGTLAALGRTREAQDEAMTARQRALETDDTAVAKRAGELLRRLASKSGRERGQ